MLLEKLRDIPEKSTVEINGQDGDIAAIGNTSGMHGRHIIKDTNRQLFIGMGRVH